MNIVRIVLRALISVEDARPISYGGGNRLFEANPWLGCNVFSASFYGNSTVEGETSMFLFNYRNWRWLSSGDVLSISQLRTENLQFLKKEKR